MAHNRDEEKEHAAMTLEWLRRNDAKWNEVLHTYLFTELPITEVEAEAQRIAAKVRAWPMNIGNDRGPKSEWTDAALSLSSSQKSRMVT